MVWKGFPVGAAVTMGSPSLGMITTNVRFGGSPLFFFRLKSLDVTVQITWPSGPMVR